MEEAMFEKGGTEYIENKISKAVLSSKREALITGNYEINRVVKIPSDFTLILDDCHLRLADNCYCNVFTNEQSYLKDKLRQNDSNISIIGKNGSIIDGGNYNGLSEKNSKKDGNPPIWFNNLILFAGVENFSISGIKFINHRWWALVFLYCSNGKISDIDFCSNDLRYNDEGELVHGFKGGTYSQILVKNADGIDLRKGCHDIEIRNIKGFTEDDTVALTLLDGEIENEFDHFSGSCNISNIKIENIKAESRCGIVRLLNQGSGKMSDIFINNVFDTSETSKYIERCDYCVRIGDGHCAYGTGGKKGISNVKINNLYSRAKFALHLGGKIENLEYENIECFDNGKFMEDLRE